MFEKIEGTEVYARRIKMSWVKDLIDGKVKAAQMQNFIFGLIAKVTCDKDGNDLPDDDFYLDEVEAIRDYVMSKINLKKKVKPTR